MLKTIAIYIRLLICSFLILNCFACEKEISIDIGNHEPKIVINAVFQGGKNWNVSVHQSKNVLSPEPHVNLDEAIVRITERKSGRNYLLKSIGEGIYTSKFELVKSGIDYKIDVSYPGLKSVHAYANAPDPIEAKITYSEIFHYNGKTALRVDFEIFDDPNNSNFYIYEILNLFPEAPTDPNTTPFLTSPIKSWLSSVDGNTGYITDATEKQSKLFVTDNNFRGSILNTSLISFVEIKELGKEPSNEIDESLYIPDFSKSKLKVTVASKELFEYYKILELFIQKRALNSSITTPIKPYSNIENGLGVFAGYNSIILSLE